MTLYSDLKPGLSINNINQLDQVMLNLMLFFRESKKAEDLVWSYLFHRVMENMINHVFERFPGINQDDSRRDMMNDYYKTMRKISKKKYQQKEEMNRREQLLGVKYRA